MSVCRVIWCEVPHKEKNRKGQPNYNVEEGMGKVRGRLEGGKET